MSFDDSFRKDRPDKTLQVNTSGRRCQSPQFDQHKGGEKTKSFALAPKGMTWWRGLERGFRFDSAGGTRHPRSKEIGRPENESHNEPGHAAKVVEQRTVLAGEEPAIAHDVQVKERRKQSKETDGQCGSAGGDGTGEVMSEPIQYLGQAGNAHNHDQISKQSRTKPESVLLKARIHPGGQRHIADLNQNDGQGAMKAGASHCRKVDQRPGGGTHQSTLPVPIDEGLLQKWRTLWEHDSIVADAPRMERQTSVTGGLRSAAYRIQVDSPQLCTDTDPRKLLMTKEQRITIRYCQDGSSRPIA